MIEQLIMDELVKANREHGLFHSLHEGYAILKEEIEEANDEITLLTGDIGLIWSACKSDNAKWANQLSKDAYTDAVHLIEEAVQVAAMARKLMLYAEAVSEDGR